jgi:NitT/TauT family transport system substrate-binding protein
MTTTDNHPLRKESTMNTNAGRRAVLRAFAAGAAGFVGARAGAAAPLDKITVAGWSKPITEVTPLLVEQDKHFFAAHGIGLAYVSGNGGGDAVRNILSGQADVAFTDPGSFFSALDKGERLRAIYDIYPQNVFNVVSLKSSRIAKPADLKGKKIGVYSLSSGTRQNLLVLLHQAGLAESDVTIVVTGLLNFAPLLQGQVDATAATDTGLLVGQRKGLPAVDVMEVSHYLNVPSDFFVVREAVYRQRPEVLKRFLAAYRDSAAWMIARPEEAAQLAVKRAIDGSDAALNLEIIRLRNAASVAPVTRQHGLGAFDLGALQKGADAYFKLGLVQHPIKVADVVSQDLLPPHAGETAR